MKEYRKLLEPLIKAGVYQESNSPHNNPVMLVAKKTPGKFRLVVDNRLVNKECKPVGAMSATPLGIIRMMAGAKRFTTIDCKNAFYSLLLAKRDRELTAISPPGCPHLQLTRMPMGAKASMSALYQAMTDTLGDALYEYVLVWADDIIIYSKTEEEHVKHVDTILDRLDKNGFCVTIEKTKLGEREVKWLGYVISEDGVKPDPEKVEVLKNMRRPRTVKELRSVMGMWTYFTTFMPGYSIIAAPLMNQLRKENKSLVWNKESIAAWQELKQKIAEAPIIGFPDYSRPFYLHTDACKSGFAAVLTQELADGRRILVDAISRTTTPAEKNYPSIKLECACIIWAIKRWKHYLYAVPTTTIVTDSYGLQYLDQGKGSESSLIERWICEIGGFEFNVQYRKGRMNIADYLSRQHDVIAAMSTRGSKKKVKKGKDKKDKRPPELPESRMEKEFIQSEQMIKEQEKDEYIQRIWAIASKEEEEEEVEGATAKEKRDARGLKKINGLIVKEFIDEGEKSIKVVVPAALQYYVVKEAHDASHAGINGTCALVNQYHWFRGIKALARRVVHHCEKCLARKGRPTRKEVLAPDERPRVLGERWHLDGLALPTSGKYNHLMVAVDGATKYVIIKQATGESARAATDLLMEIIRRFGRPQRIVSDKGTAFTSKAFSMACEIQGIKFSTVATGRPQGNGMVERENRTILDTMSIMCNGIGKSWAKYVGEVEFALNTRVSEVTKHSPYELVYGRLPPGPIYIDMIRNWEQETEGREDLESLRRRIYLLQQTAYENQREAAELQRKNHDKHAVEHRFKIGDKVVVRKENRDEVGVMGKLSWNWKGPYKISEVVGPVTYRLEDMNGKKLKGVAHSEDLAKMDDSPLP